MLEDQQQEALTSQKEKGHVKDKLAPVVLSTKGDGK